MGVSDHRKNVLLVKKADAEKFREAIADGVDTWAKGSISTFFKGKTELGVIAKHCKTRDDKDAILHADEVWAAHPSPNPDPDFEKDFDDSMHDIYLGIESLGIEFNIEGFPENEYDMLEFKNEDSLKAIAYGLAFKIV